MRARISLLLALAATPSFAALHPDAVASGSNALGNTVYCYTSGSTGTTMCLNNVDGAGVGFNDATAAAPVGGNPGTTVGEQRINAYIQAFKIWGDTLTTPSTVMVQGTFGPLACTATGGTLGAAGTIQIFSFNGIYGGGFVWPSTWYHSALASRIVGSDVTPGGPDPGLLLEPFNDDIVSFFNGNLGITGCLTGLTWYYGYDNLEGSTQIDFLSVLLHEVGHGLGHANFIDENGNPNGCTTNGNCVQHPGGGPGGLPDIYTVFSKENGNGKHWNQMTNAERAASSTSGTLAWDGPNSHAAAAAWLIGPVLVRENTPTAVDFAANPAAYGPLPSFPGVTADVVLVDDGTGATADGCTAFVNAGAVSGNIALIDRGTCTFVVKSANAQAAGAVGVIIANNAASGFPSMGGSDPTSTIVSVGVTQATGNAIKAELLGGPVNVTILADTSLGLQGADADGHPLLYTPSVFASGSSVSHWDTTAFPNLMMEPSINADLRTATTLDISPAQMDDIGWDADIDCPTNSDDSLTIVIDGCDSGAPNFAGPWTIFPTPRGKGVKTTSGVTNGGCYLADLFHGCVGSTTHGNFVSCSANTASTLVKQGVLFQSEADAIMACVEAADLP